MVWFSRITSSVHHVCKDPKGKQSEDCLTLSVFKPQNADASKQLPVLVWTHGGGFNVGSSDGSFVPSMVGNAPHDFIGVTFKYRLGALGFLPSNLTHKAGLLNLGLEDQVMAYGWVQKYIELFGGDPNKVTVGL
jgi:acetylcholinesterase